MEYRHYSFDMWNTLIKPNPNFSKMRTHHMHINLLKQGKLVDGEKIDMAFREVGEYHDSYCEMTGKSPDAFDLYAMVLYKLKGNLKSIKSLDIELLYKEIEEIFLQNPPALYDEDTLDVLNELQKRGKTMSILSNTAFIRGDTLDKVLKMYGIYDHFVFTFYSDQFDLSKPNMEFFRKVDYELPYDTEHVIHVGDNELADRIGAQEYGFGHMIINSNSYTIKDLL